MKACSSEAEGQVPERPWDAEDGWCTDCQEDPCACDDDDEDWCDMCSDERPCQCDVEIWKEIHGVEDTEEECI